MFFILLLTLAGVTTVSLPRTMAQEAGVGSWFTLLLSAVLYAIPASIILALNRIFRGEVLYDYSKRLVGKFGTFLLGIFYMLYFLFVAGFLCGNMANILSGNFFPNTPPLGIILIGVPFYAYTAYKGIRTVARFCEIVGVLFITIAIIIHIAMLTQGELNYIQPFFVPEDTLSYFKAIPATITSFLGIEVMTLIPIAQQDRKKAPKVAFFVILVIGLFFILVVESSIMMIGMNEIKNNNNALISAIRHIEIPALSFFERMDVFYLTIGFLGMYCTKTIALFSAIEYACKILPKVKRIIIVIAVSAFMVLIDVIYFSNEGFVKFFKIFFLSAGNAAATGIPLILLILAKVKGHAYKKIELILTVLLCLMMMAGCWDSKDIEDKKIATLVIVDKLEDKYSFFLEFAEQANGSSDGSDQKKNKGNFMYQEAEGNTLAQAREALDAKTNKQVYLGAVNAVLITENLAKEGIAEYIYRLRDISDYRKVVDISITSEPPEAFEDVEAGAQGVGMAIENTLATLKALGEPYNHTDMGDVLEALADPYGSFVLPTVGIENKEVKITGLSVFEGEMLKGFIPWQDYGGIRYLKGVKPTCYCVVPLNDNEATIHTKLTKKKLTPTYSEDMVSFKVEVIFDAHLAYISDRAKVSEGDFNTLKDELEQHLKREIEEAIRISQQDFQCDYLGFSVPFRIKYPVVFRQMNWKEIFPKATITVEVKANLDASGTIDFLPQYDYKG